MSNAPREIQALLDELTVSGRERGLQVAAYLNGELAIDAWSGTVDRAGGRPVDGDTLFTIFSCTKGVTATAIHQLAERGRLDYDDPIAQYWPEFGVNGKERVTIRQALTHSAGLPQLPPDTGPAEISDWDGICAAIAAGTPLWEPGTATGYHAISYGWLLGEVVRRVDGRSFAEYVAAEISAPAGIPDLYLGIPDAVEDRVATLENGPAPEDQPPPDSLYYRAIPSGIGNLARVFNRPDVRRASIPGAGGIANARSLARHYAALAGPVDGVRLLAPERVKAATTLQTEAVDLVLGEPIRKALGYRIGQPTSPMGERPTVFGHPGAGGTIGFADPDHGFAFALLKNRMIWTDPPGETTANLVASAVRKHLGVPETA